MRYLFSLLLLGSAAISHAQHTGHPRLFFGLSDIPNIASSINQSGSAASELYSNITRQSDYFGPIQLHPLFHHDPGPHNKAAYYHCILSLAFRYVKEKQDNIANYVQWADRAKYLIFNPTPDPQTDPDWFIHQGIIYDDWSAQPAGNGKTTAQRVIALSILYDWLYDRLDSNQQAQIQNTIISDLSWTDGVATYPGGIRAAFTREDAYRIRLEWVPPALLLGAMSLYGENPAYSTAQADSDITAALDYEFRASTSYINRYFSPYDGAHGDGITYPLWEAHLPTLMLDAWSRWDTANHWIDPDIKDRLSKVGEWLAYNVLPDPQQWPCSFNVINDAYAWHFSPMSFLLTLSAKYSEQVGVNRWVFNHTIQTIPNLLQNVANYNYQQEVAGGSVAFILPIIEGYAGNATDALEPSTILPSSKSMPWNGEVHIRTSSAWGDSNDIQFAFTCRPSVTPTAGVIYQHRHDHPDKNHFSLSAFGDLYIHGYGYGDPEQAPEYHNEVLIDDGTGGGSPHWKGEAWPGYLSGQVSGGEIIQYANSPGFDYIHGDATSAYDTLRWGVGEPIVTYTEAAPGPDPAWTFNTVQSAQRYVLFSRSSDNIRAYVIIADDIQKDANAHKYSWRFHSPKARSISNENQVRLEGNYGYLDLFFTASSSLGQTETILPQHQPSGGVAMPEAVMVPTVCDGYSLSATDKFTNTTVNNPYFHVILVPSKPSDLPPAYTTLAATNGSIVSLEWPTPSDYTDYSVFKYQNGTQITGQGVATDAKLSRIRFNTSSGAVMSFVVGEGTALSFNGQELVNLYGQQGTVMMSGSTVDIISTAVTYFRVYSPDASSVKINGESVGFVQVGNYVEFHGNVYVSAGRTLTLSDNMTLTIHSGDTLFVDGTLQMNGNVTINGSGVIKVGYPGSFIVSSNATATLNCIKLVAISTSGIVSVQSGGTLRIMPSTILSFEEGTIGLTVYGKLVANGTQSQRIVFTSSAAAKAPGDWAGIVCLGGGPDTLTYCDIKYAENGISFTNTSPNSYMYNDTVAFTSSNGNGVKVMNVNTGNTALTMYKCGITNNDHRALHIYNAKVKLSYSRIENNGLQSISTGVYVGSGGMLYADSSRIQNNNGSGIDVSGLNSKLSLSPNEIAGGYNTIYQHGVSELYIHNSATAILGYLYEYACCECEQRALVFRGLKGINTPCPPPCTPGYCIGTHAGYNNISNTFSYTGRLINFTKGGVQEAMRNYWYYGGGSAAPNGFVGAVDTSFPLRSAVSTPAKAVPILSGDTPLGVDPEGDKLIGWILRLEEKVDSNAGDAVDAIHHLSAMIGPGGAYADVTVGSSWRDILTRVKNSSASPRLVRLAKSMGIRDALNEGTFGEGIRLADDLLNSDIDDDTWLYCKTRKIFGFVGLGNLRQANAVFAEMQSRGRMVDTAAMNGMEDYLRLAALSVSVDGSQGESVKQSTAESKTTPRTTSIAQNYPNPFNPVTSFTYQIASAGHVSLKIYDVLGREVATIVDGVKEPGEYNVSWEANGFSSGVYFFKLQADSFSAVKKMLLIR